MCTSILTAAGRDVQLKWHKLRRHTPDPAMQRVNLHAGLEAAAVMEVDLRLTRDGQFVCLHDERLDGETTGVGPVSEQTANDLRSLRMRDPAGRATDERLLFFDEIVETTERLAAPGAEVQLDLKEPAEAMNDKLLEPLAGQLARSSGSFSLSGTDVAALERLRSAVPTLRVTYSCSERLTGARDAREFRSRLEGELGAADELAAIWVEHPVLAAAYESGFDLVGFAHERGVLVDTGTIDVESPGGRQALEQALSVGVDRITTNSPCLLAASQVAERATTAAS